MQNHTTDIETLRAEYDDCCEAVHDGKAMWLTDVPIHYNYIVREGRASWIASEDRAVPCCDGESDPCRSCGEHPADMDDRYRAEYHVAVARTMSGLPFRPEPVGMVDCPRCMGLGVRQFDGFDGPCYEPCTSCEDGKIDAETASTIARLMDLADAESDPEAWDDDCTWVPTDTPEPTLPELIAVEIGCYRRMGTPFGDLMAETVERLQSVVSALEARTVEDYHDRRAAMLGGF